MVEFWLFPFTDPVMQMAFIVALILSVPAALLSCVLVLRGWALMGDALSHAVLPGIVVAYLVGLPFLIGAMVAALICTYATRFITDHSRIKPDTVLGVIFSGMFGAGIVLYAAVPSDLHLDHILFGDLLGLGMQEFVIALCAAVLVSGFMALRYRDVMILLFDEVQARVLGLPIGFLNGVLLALLAFTIVATLQASGLILAIALVITPGAAAYLITRRFGAMLITAVIIAAMSSVIGIYTSFWLDSAPAPTVVLCLTFIFMICFGFYKWRMAMVARLPYDDATDTDAPL